MKINFLFLLCLCSFSLFSQEVWDLERCILYAQQNSLNMQQAQVDIKQAQVENQGNKLARLPNLNAGTTGQLNFGKTVDFTTNTFASEARSNQSLFLSTNVVLYNGGRIRNSIKQSQFNIEAASADADDIANNMALQVATAYLNILLAEEQLANSQKRAEQTQQQLSQTDKLISAGTRPEADRLDIVAQLARDEQAIVTQSNSVDIAYLSLKQLLELPPDYDLIISRPDIVVPVANPENFNLTEVYALALRTQPQIKAGEMRMMAAKVDMDLARSNILPSVTFFASLNSNISSIAQDFTNPNTDNVFTVFEEGPVIINGEDAILATPEVRGVTFPNATYIDQLNDNFGQGIGFSIDVPIYNRGRTQIAKERATLGIKSTEVNNNRIKQQLKADIQTAIANAKAAKKQWEAATRTVEALRLAYDNAQKRFDLGVINTFEYTTSKNNLDQAEVDLIVAKYDYVFRLKIVDFYTGKKLSVN